MVEGPDEVVLFTVLKNGVVTDDLVKSLFVIPARVTECRH